MAINTDLLVSAAMLQDYIVDKDDGFPLANGIISLYKDQARSFYKNWYYQTGVPGAYTWVALDNPLHLSSVGTIQDPNGNDVIPFYYPFEETDENVHEAYYITVYSVDSNGDPAVLQFTRENFPFVGGGLSPIATVPTLKNYIFNNVYWRNNGPADLKDQTNVVVAPSQHDGYTNPDIRFLKNVTGADDDLAFLPMTESIANDITPEIYLNMRCNGVQAGETQKCIQYPVSLHVKTLANVAATLVIDAQNVSGNVNNYLDLYVYQFLGTGAITQPAPILIQRIILNNTFQKQIIPFIFPDDAGLSLGAGGDDALFIQVQYPLSKLFEINHTKPSIYLSATVPDNDFSTYDEIETIINSPRTGDYRTSLNSFVPFGWVPANDGSIGDATSSATSRANKDTWPLYNLLWNSILDHWAPVSTGRGASAYLDFAAHKRLTLTRNLGRVIAGLNPIITALVFTTNYGVSNFNLTVSSSANYLTGTPVQFTNTGGSLPSALAINTVYYVINIDAVTIQVATTLDLAYAGTPFNIGSDSTGISVVQTSLGAYIGESTHAMTLSELVAHHHQYIQPNAGGAGGSPSGTTTLSLGDTTTVGSSVPFNVIQPTVYGNVFIKL